MIAEWKKEPEKEKEKAVKKLTEIYQRRQEAHASLLACDVELDNILKSFIIRRGEVDKSNP